jgi:hypothetical protein
MRAGTWQNMIDSKTHKQDDFEARRIEPLIKIKWLSLLIKFCLSSSQPLVLAKLQV